MKNWKCLVAFLLLLVGVLGLSGCPDTDDAHGSHGQACHRKK